MKRDFSLREPTTSQERSGKRKSARSVRNDGWGPGDGHGMPCLYKEEGRLGL